MSPRPPAGGTVVLAPAKLNLFLEVHRKRPDGYHDIESLMVAVDGLHDTITIADDPSGAVALTCDDPELPTGPDNLIVRAADALRSEAEPGRRLGASIALRKAIPARAGLGGGSSDAAATLRALDGLWGLATPAGRLDAIAAGIGSDVPFFLHAPAAVCRGRGERVEPAGPAPAMAFVVVCPPAGVSTADVYARLTPPDRPRPIGPILEAWAGGDARAVGSLLFNRLQPIAESLCPALKEVRDALAACPSLDGSLMSGSGSAYFGLARSKAAADDAAARLSTPGLGRVRVVAPDVPEQ